MWNIIFLIFGAIFIALLLIVVFSKGVINSRENSLFKLITISNAVGYFIEIPLQLLVRNININNPIIDFYCRIYLISITLCYALFTMYVFVICLNKQNPKYENEVKISIKTIGVIEVIVSLLLFVLPFSKYYDTTKMYIYGQALDLLKVYITCYIILYVAFLLKNYKQLKNKKYLPIYFVIILLIFMTILNSVDPSILITNMIATFICYMMFFTIENPDVKLLQEAHKAKEISDMANEEKTLFLYNMTQEIRNITNMIDDYADLILDSKDWEETYDSARDIKANTSKFTNMTNDILDVSSIDSTTIKVYNEKYNIKNILKQLISVYGESCKNKELKFRTNIDHDIPDSLYGDSINLKEVLNTILNNSVKYTSKGFIELDVNTIIKNDICRLIITIEDSGIGIKSEDINKIKLDNKSLAKANKLITTMNGTMMISSDYGVGTKVKVILDQKIGEETDSEVAKYESVFDDIKILSVDDSEAGLKIIDKLLRGTNIMIDYANTGKECLDKIRVSKYDLILLDEELEEMTGIDLMKKMKEIRNFNTPVIFLTKDNSYEYNEEYSKVGFSDYLLKPLKKDELINKIDMYTKKDKK